MNHLSCAQKGLVLALTAALLTPAAALATQAMPPSPATGTASRKTSRQDEKTTKKQQEKPTRLKSVVVLGSLIPQVEVANAVPLSTYTPAEIHAQGFSSFADFMQHVPQASIVAAPDSQGAARAARPFEMHDLGPSRTLLLIDGQRGVDYPQPGSLSTSEDLSIIPPGLVQQVEITPSGLSSLYGSDAMNGVADVILKHHVQGDHLQVTGGVDTSGGEHDRDVQFFGGRSGNKWNVMYSFEHKADSALFLGQRSRYADLANAGYGTYGPADRMYGYQYGAHGGTAVQLSQQTADGARYMTPPAGACSALGFEEQDSHPVETSGDAVGTATDLGSECVNPEESAGLALEPATKSNYVFLHGDYDFTPDVQGFATLTYFGSAVRSGSGQPELGDGGLPVPFYDSSSGQIITGFTRQLTSAETGENSLTVKDDEHYWDLRAGVNGAFGNFNWDASLSTQKYFVNAHYRAFDAVGAFNYFFGQQQGTKTIDGTTYPVYAVNDARFWGPITPAAYDSFAPTGVDRSNSFLDIAQFDLNNTELFDIPWNGQPVGWAVRVTATHQGLATSPDPRQLQPLQEQQLQFEAPFGGVFGSATEMHYAIASEFSIPLTNWLTFGTSGRIDKYNGPSAADLARTWSASLQVRPYSGLLLRGSYNTTFRAPGLAETSFHDSPTISTEYADPLQCILNNEDPCVSEQHSQPIEEGLAGNPFLKPEKGDTESVGFVWQIPGVKNMSLSADYWRESVRDGIDVFGAGTILTLDAACLTGLEVGGQPFRGSAGTEIVSGENSPVCPAIEKAVPRASDGQLLGVNAIPINISRFLIRGIDYTWQYDLDMQTYGSLGFRVQYDDLPYEAAAGAPGQPYINVAYGRSVGRMMWSAVWNRGKWNASLGGNRYAGLEADQYGGCEVLPNGIIPRVGDPECTIYRGRTLPWITWSASVGYQFTRKLKALFMVHNIFNKEGQIMFYGSATGIPTNEDEYFTGRQISLTLDYQLD